MVIITAGNKYLDIDAYASGIAYAILLRDKGVDCEFISTAKPNMSISEIVQNLGFGLQKDYCANNEDEFIIVDLSNPNFFDKIVNDKNIIEVIDHHTGYEEFWKNKKISNTIEFIGSVATIVYEKFIAENKVDLLDEKLCKLLICAILDNTLNLKSNITTKRDIDAYYNLHKIGNVPTSFDNEYFLSCQESINRNVLQSIINDIKCEKVSDFLPEVFGQIMVYDKSPIFHELQNISNYMDKMYDDWLVNIICLSDGKSYLYTSNPKSQNKLEQLFSKKFENRNLVLDKFMLRKEIMKKARNFLI